MRAAISAVGGKSVASRGKTTRLRLGGTRPRSEGAPSSLVDAAGLLHSTRRFESLLPQARRYRVGTMGAISAPPQRRRRQSAGPVRLRVGRRSTRSGPLSRTGAEAAADAICAVECFPIRAERDDGPPRPACSRRGQSRGSSCRAVLMVAADGNQGFPASGMWENPVARITPLGYRI